MDLRKLAFSIDFSGVDSRPIDKANKSMDNIKKSMGGVFKESNKVGKGIDKSMDTRPVDKMKNAATKAKDAFGGIGKKAKEIQPKLNDLGKSLSMKVTAPVATIGTAGTKMFLDLDKSIRKVTTLADKDILPIDKIRKEVREISDASGIAQTQIAESIYDSLSAGVDSSQVIEFVKSGIDLTRAGFTDMQTAIDATTTVMNAYGENAFEISKIHDIFVQTQDKGKISVDELGKSIGRVVPTASSLGVNMDQLGASYAILTAQGHNAQLATTNLNSMLDELGKTGSSADEILKKQTGKSFGELTKEGKSLGDVLGILDNEAKASNMSLKDMFSSGNAGTAAITLLSKGAEGFNSSLADMNNATGKTAENAEIMEDGWLKIERAINSLKNTAISFGDMIAPTIEKVADKVSGAIEWFNGLDESTRRNIGRFTLFATAVGPATMGISRLIGFASDLPDKMENAKSAMNLFKAAINPTTLPIVALIGAGVLLFKNWDKIKEKAGELKNKVSEHWGNLKTKTAEHWDNMKSKVSSSLDGMREKWEGVKSFFKNPIKGTVNIVQKGVAKIKDRFSHASGAYNIPYDNYPANLHKREMVLTASAAEKFRAMGGTENKVPSIIDTSNSRVSNKSFTENISNIYNRNKVIDNSKSTSEVFNKSISNIFNRNKEIDNISNVNRTINQDRSRQYKEYKIVNNQADRENKNNITFNPVYNIELSGSATEKDKREIENVIDKKTRELFNQFFKEMNMKMA